MLNYTYCVGFVQLTTQNFDFNGSLLKEVTPNKKSLLP